MAPLANLHHRIDHVLGFDLVQRAQLPDAEKFLHRPGQPAQNIDAVDRLVDQRAAAFGLPAALDRPRIILRRAIPLDVAIGLQQFAQPSAGDRLRQEQAGIVEAMLAHHAQHDAGLARRLHHLARGLQVRRNRLLHLHVLPGLGADRDRLHAEIRKRADVHVVHLRVAAHLFVSGDEFGAVLLGETPAARLEDVRAHGQLKPDIFIGLGVLVRNRARADHSDSHG